MDSLFELPEAQPKKAPEPTRPEVARLYQPVRNQLEMVPRDLDSTLPEDHVARAIWAFLEKLDLASFYASIKAVIAHPGHPATDPKVLLALWLLATVDGVGKARQLDRLCREHDAYRWLRGGVPVNYHLLADFRVGHQKELDELMSQILAAMMSTGLVTLRQVAQDGMRVRASAGSGSFRRKKRLEEYLEEARTEVTRLAQERDCPETPSSRKQQAARERAARERCERLQEALDNLPKIQEARDKRAKKDSKVKRACQQEVRVSMTDPEARVMRMPDGGFRPAFNLQIATDVDSQVILGVEVTNKGSDAGLAVPMVEQIEKRVKSQPKGYLFDNGFATREDITALTRKGIVVYAPPPSPRKPPTEGTDEPVGAKGDTPEVVQWRERMRTEEAKTIYKERASTAECVNALGRARGLTQLVVRGTAKVLSTLLLVAITHNLMRWLSLTT
jgi:Transposase and inactivated derivatives